MQIGCHSLQCAIVTELHTCFVVVSLLYTMLMMEKRQKTSGSSAANETGSVTEPYIFHFKNERLIHMSNHFDDIGTRLFRK